MRTLWQFKIVHRHHVYLLFFFFKKKPVFRHAWGYKEFLRIYAVPWYLASLEDTRDDEGQRNLVNTKKSCSIMVQAYGRGVWTNSFRFSESYWCYWERRRRITLPLIPYSWHCKKKKNNNNKKKEEEKNRGHCKKKLLLRDHE